MSAHLPPRDTRPLDTRRLKAWDEHKTDLDWFDELLNGRIWTALRAVEHCRRILRERERALVRGARRMGMSWEQIAGYMRTSRQAVHRSWKYILEPEKREGPPPRHKRIGKAARDGHADDTPGARDAL